MIKTIKDSPDSKNMENKTIQYSSDGKNMENKTIQDSLDSKNTENKTIQDSLDSKNTENKTIQDSLDSKNTENKTIQDSSDDKNMENKTIQDSSDGKNMENKTIQDSSDGKNMENKTIQDSLDSKNMENKTIQDSPDLKNKEKKTNKFFYDWPSIQVIFRKSTNKEEENWIEVKMEKDERAVMVKIDKSILREENEILEDENKKTFLNYRNNYLSEMNEYCNEVSRPINRIVTNKNYGLKKVPKCLMHKSRKACNCKPECVESIWKDFKFSESCKFYDLENLNTDDSYIDHCDSRTYELGDHVEEKESQDKIKSEFSKDLDKLCIYSSLYSSIKCSAYRLRDECRNDSTCLEEDFSYIVKKRCPNREYNKQVEEFQKILGIKFGEKNEDLNLNSNRKLLSIDDNVLFNENYNDDVILSKNYMAKNGMVLISSVGISLICLLAMYKRNTSAPTIRNCMIVGVLILFSLILASLTF